MAPKVLTVRVMRENKMIRVSTESIQVPENSPKL